MGPVPEMSPEHRQYLQRILKRILAGGDLSTFTQEDIDEAYRMAIR